MIRVSRIEPGSIAAEIGLKPGTELLTLNGRDLNDFLDWEFLGAEDELVIDARLPNGDAVIYEIERPEGVPMGVELEAPSVRRCANRCEFCFVEGLPPGLRRNLYIRDDDYRLSFAYGNFATLSNLRERDVARILEYRLSPRLAFSSMHKWSWFRVSMTATSWNSHSATYGSSAMPACQWQSYPSV
jgi:NifB/MoaA-like Fe-S oxidoreductase